MDCKKKIFDFGGMKRVESNLRQGACGWKCLFRTEIGARTWCAPVKPALTSASTDSTKSFKLIQNNSKIVQPTDIYVEKKVKVK